MRIELLPATLDEVSSYYELFSSEAVCRFMDLVPFRSLEDARSFLGFSNQQRLARKSFRHSIQVDGSFVGTTCLYSLYWHQKRASVGYALRQDHWRLGIMSETLDILSNYARNDLGLNRLQATVLPENDGSKALLAKSGYLYEGLLRQYEIWEGKGFVDLEMYAKIL